jgi:hypothetical protein
MSESGRDLLHDKKASSGDRLAGALSPMAIALLGLDHQRGLHRRRHADCPICGDPGDPLVSEKARS